MSKGLEALKEIREYCSQERTTCVIFDGLRIIEQELKDYEWLLSIINIGFFCSLDREERTRLYELIKERIE